MRIAVAGAGPAGLILGAALSRRGHAVVAVDRDPGPAADGTWRRRGVMQFEHAHGFRPQVPLLLSDEWPAAYEAWMSLGAEAVTMNVPGRAYVPQGVLSRRCTFERALREAAAATPGLELRCGHVDGLVQLGGRVTGLVVDGAAVSADLVVDATGRSGRIGEVEDELEGDCGLAYVDRCYRLLPGAEPGPLLNALLWAGNYDGYQVLVFVHEQRHFSVLFVRPTADVQLKDLRHRPAFEAACRMVPALAAWTDPDRSAPTSDVLVGGALRNIYRRQLGLPGLVSVGDAVSTTTPTAGRGVAMTCMQLRALLGLLDGGTELVTVAEPFGAWCEAQIRPWVEDHITLDTESAALWQGADIDLGRPLSSTRILDAAQVDERISAYAGGYIAMTELPSALAPAEPLARAVYETGWRAPHPAGPTRDQLVAVVEGTLKAGSARRGDSAGQRGASRTPRPRASAPVSSMSLSSGALPDRAAGT